MKINRKDLVNMVDILTNMMEAEQDPVGKSCIWSAYASLRLYDCFCLVNHTPLSQQTETDPEYDLKYVNKPRGA